MTARRRDTAKPRRRITRPCIDCGASTTRDRCPKHSRAREVERQSRQPYRAAYFTPEYRRAKKERFVLVAGGRCEALVAGGDRCSAPATEAHHVIPLATARTFAEAVALCRVELLRAVCHEHNPRGP